MASRSKPTGNSSSRIRTSRIRTSRISMTVNSMTVNSTVSRTGSRRAVDRPSPRPNPSPRLRPNPSRINSSRTTGSRPPTASRNTRSIRSISSHTSNRTSSRTRRHTVRHMASSPASRHMELAKWTLLCPSGIRNIVTTQMIAAITPVKTILVITLLLFLSAAIVLIVNTPVSLYPVSKMLDFGCHGVYASFGPMKSTRKGEFYKTR